MKSHAVPQEIMSVEFKLFGNFLSLREFIFIAIGLALAWFIYFLMNKGLIPPIIAWPAILLIGGGGILIGLVPFQDRSLDQWIRAYLAAIQRPTQRVWKKSGFDPIKTMGGETISMKEHLITPPTAAPAFLGNPPTKITVTSTDEREKLERDEAATIERIGRTIVELEKREREKVKQQTTTVSTAPIPSNITRAVKIPETTRVTTASPIQIPPAPQNSAAPPDGKTAPQQLNTNGETQNTHPPKPPVVNKHPTNQDINKPQIAKQQSIVQPNQSDKNQPGSIPPTQQSVSPTQQLAHVSITDENIQDYKTDLPGLDIQPNTINIVVKDQSGQQLSQVTCIVKDQQGEPVRAAISNPLGQIINNIPLKNGTYTIQLTKAGYIFPIITRNLTGKIYPAFEIKSL